MGKGEIRIEQASLFAARPRVNLERHRDGKYVGKVDAD